MPFIRVKGFQIFKDRHGKQRCYHRKTKAVVDLKRFPMGSAEFLAECARIAGLLNLAAASRPGTLGALIVAYRSSPAFQELAPRTRRDYQRCFDYLQPIAETPLVRFDRPLIVRIRDKAAETHKRRYANYVRTAISILLSCASSVATLSRIRPKASRPFRNWSPRPRMAR